jgi:hypothetical protein
MDVTTRHSTEASPACALTLTALADRLGAWRALIDQAASRTAGPGWMEGTYPVEARAELEALIEAEADCCPFLSFEVRERDEFVEVRLEFPPEFVPVIAAL